MPSSGGFPAAQRLAAMLQLVALVTQGHVAAAPAQELAFGDRARGLPVSGGNPPRWLAQATAPIYTDGSVYIIFKFLEILEGGGR